jgi:hypothetical protein
MMYAANRPCGKRLIVAFYDIHSQCSCGEGLIVVPSLVAILGRGLSLPSLGKGSLLPSLTNVASLVFYDIFGILAILALVGVHAFSSVLAVPNFGVFALLIVVWHNMVIVASCEWQHEHLIVVWELLLSYLAFVFYRCCSLQCDIRK